MHYLLQSVSRVLESLSRRARFNDNKWFIVMSEVRRMALCPLVLAHTKRAAWVSCAHQQFPCPMLYGHIARLFCPCVRLGLVRRTSAQDTEYTVQYSYNYKSIQYRIDMIVLCSLLFPFWDQRRSYIIVKPLASGILNTFYPF